MGATAAPKSAAFEPRRLYHSKCYPGLNHARVRKGSGPEVTAALRNAAIGFLRSTGATKIVETIRRNASQPGQLFAKLDVFKK